MTFTSSTGHAACSHEKDFIRMNGFKNVRTFKRSFSIEQPLNHTSIGMELQSCVEHFSLDQRQSAIFRVPFDVSSNHTISNDVFPLNIFNQIENQMRRMSRTELEIFTHSKIIESNKYKHHSQEIEKKCNVLQSSFDEMKQLYAETYKKHADLKQHCDRFFLNVQAHRTDDDNDRILRTENVLATTDSR